VCRFERRQTVLGEEKPSVVEAVRAAILRGEYAPRQRMIEVDMCERFGASRFGIRTVLQELASQGLIELLPNRGARVRDISFAEAIEITEVRMLLEGFEAGRAADRASKADIAALRRIIKEMRSAVSQNELLRYSDLNVELHTTIRNVAAHDTAARLLRQLRDQTVRHQFSLSLVPGRPTISLPQHEAIVEAIIRKEATLAQDAMHAHLRSVVEAFRSLNQAASQ
jgi:DNA-binding GntR family transcriptional regulator